MVTIRKFYILYPTYLLGKVIGAEIMQDTLLEQILYQSSLDKKGCAKTIDQYAIGTIALFTPFDPPKLSVPIIGSLATISEPLGISIKPNSTKLFVEEVKSPLIRIDRKAHDGLPTDHLQFGANTYTGRHGNEAYDIVAEVMKSTKRELLFPFDEKKKPWEY